MHVLRYLKSTAHYSLCYGEGKTLEGYTDASFANEPDSCKSVSGNVFLLNNSAISWRSALQSIVAASTCEAEYVALYSATKECMYLRQLLEEMGIDCASPTIIHEDNQPAIQVAQNHITNSKSKHMKLKFHFVRHAIGNKWIDVKYCSTSDMLADGLTKPLPVELQKRFFNVIFNQNNIK